VTPRTERIGGAGSPAIPTVLSDSLIVRWSPRSPATGHKNSTARRSSPSRSCSTRPACSGRPVTGSGIVRGAGPGAYRLVLVALDFSVPRGRVGVIHVYEQVNSGPFHDNQQLLNVTAVLILPASWNLMLWVPRPRTRAATWVSAPTSSNA